MADAWGMPLLPSRGGLRLLLFTFLALLVPGALWTSSASAAPQTAAVQTHLLWSRYDAAARERQLDLARDAGAGMVRVDLGWASLEQGGKGQINSWYLGKIDHVVAQAQARGLKVLFTVWETPCWASTAPESLKQGCAGSWWDRDVQRYPPADAADYGDALAFLVGRYGDRVAAWELWNEPNHPTYFRGPDQAGNYATLVKAAYPAAKAADPSATIIAGSLADADYQFTQSLLERGIGGHFDAYSVHPYSEDRSPIHPGLAGWAKKSFAAGVPLVRQTLLAHGQAQPIWLTEFGWSTCSVRGQPGAYDNCVDASTQADWLEQAYAHMTNWSYVPVGVWFNIEDTSDDTGDRVDNYGLVNTAGAPKPAYAAFRRAATALQAGAGFTPVNGNPSFAGAAPGAPAIGGRPAGRVGATPGPRTAQRNVTLRLARRGRQIRIRGKLTWGRTLQVRAYRWKPRQRRYSRVTSYRALIGVSPSGDYLHRIRNARVARGRWLIVVKGRRQPLLQARAVLRG